MFTMGEVMRVKVRKVFGKSLNLLLHFAVNPKLL